MAVLVAYGSKRGGTEGLAQMLADGLRSEALKVDLAPARQVRDLSGYDAVLVGGALYVGRWYSDARRFVRRNAGALCQRPTWFFSSGPLDSSAAEGDIPPVKGVRALMGRVGARGHATFGGRLAPDAKGYPASAMAKKSSGDWRDQDQVNTWARAVASELRSAFEA